MGDKSDRSRLIRGLHAVKGQPQSAPQGVDVAQRIKNWENRVRQGPGESSGQGSQTERQSQRTGPLARGG